MIGALLALGLQAAASGPADDPIGSFIEENAASVREMRIAAAPADFCDGDFRQGSFLVCRFMPGARVELGEIDVTADADGYVMLAIPRRAPGAMPLRITYEREDGTSGDIAERLDIASREYDLQHVDGVPQSTVTPDPSTLPRRQREYAQKQEAFNSVWDGTGFLDGFIPPAEGITTGIYGSARVYNNGHEGSPHWGLDWANDVGTPIYAPAGGRVTLAEPDMYYEGGLIFIDHGQGLVSAFLHLSGVSVEAGDIVEQGQLIGQMGAGGRATGSHLDWRVKLRNQFYADPATLLELDPASLD